MVASKVRKAARKDARQKLLESRRHETKKAKLAEAVFGEFEKDGEKAPDASDRSSANDGTDDSGDDAVLHLDQGTEMDEDKPKPKKGHVTKEEAKALKQARKEKKREERKALEAEKNKPRFICFVGHLPLTTTVEAIKKHFAKLEPFEIRHSTQKGTQKSRGFAFLEFDSHERMNDCLTLYHHSMFDDGLGGEPSKINIELTAGGGGSKSQERKDRIKVKNSKLKEERKKKKEAKQEAKRERRANMKAPKRDKTKYNNRRGKWAPHRIAMGTGANATAPTNGKTTDGNNSTQGGSVHPSRLGRIQDASA